MRMFVLSVLFAAGVGLAGAGGAAAAPATGGFSPATGINPLVQKTYVVVVRHPHRCHRVKVCHVGPYGHRHCHWDTVCRH